jgi:hypothetical protein
VSGLWIGSGCDHTGHASNQIAFIAIERRLRSGF